LINVGFIFDAQCLDFDKGCPCEGTLEDGMFKRKTKQGLEAKIHSEHSQNHTSFKTACECYKTMKEEAVTNPTKKLSDIFLETLKDHPEVSSILSYDIIVRNLRRLRLPQAPTIKSLRELVKDYLKPGKLDHLLMLDGENIYIVSFCLDKQLNTVICFYSRDQHGISRRKNPTDLRNML
jgi:hypothetical protein